MTPPPEVYPPTLDPPEGHRHPRVAAGAAYSVHLLTASGVIFLFLAAAELMTADPQGPRAWLVFVWFIGATVVDAIDGPLARRADVKGRVPGIDGRTIDDLIDYIGFTFLPLMLVWRMGWLPGGASFVSGVFVVVPMMASLLGFAHRHAKDERAGFFRGFPSYWNILAFYAGLAAVHLGQAGQWLNAAVLLALAALTVSPVWLVYPNLAPRPWKGPILVGSYVWLAALLAMLPFYPSRVPPWAAWASLAYPAFYLVVSVALRDRWPRSSHNGSRWPDGVAT